MASTGSIIVAVTAHDDLEFKWTIASQSTANNSSTVNWSLTLITDDTGRIDSTKPKAWSATVNGNPYSGTTYIGISNNATKVLFSGQTVIPHNSDGTKTFSFSFTQEIAITFSGSRIESKSGSGTGTLDAIPRGATLTAAPNFNDEGNPTITYSNPLGNDIESLRACISFEGTNADIEYRDIPKTGTSYTFELTDAEREILRNGTTTSNTRTVYFYLRSVVSGTVFSSKLSKTLTIVNCSPTINPTVVDINDATIALTGSNTTLVRYFSEVAYNINAAARKGATITSQKLVVGDMTLTTASGTIPEIEYPTFIFSVTDSRGNVVTKTIERTFVEYVKLTADISVSNPTGDGDATIFVLGNYFNGSFGVVDNTLTLSYRHKVDNGSYGNWVSIPFITINSYSYESSVAITGLDYQKKHTFQIMAVDSVGIVYSIEKSVRAVPVFDWGPSDFKFNVPIEAPDVSAGSVHATSINVNNLYDKFAMKYTNGLAIYETAGIDPDTTLDHLILTHLKTPNGTYMYIKTEFYASKSEDSNRMQMAFPYNKTGAPFFRRYYNGAWSEWEGMASDDGGVEFEYGTQLPTTNLYEGRLFFLVG